MRIEQSISTVAEFTNFPEGQEALVYTDADITIAFWMNTKNAYGEEIAVTAPGAYVGCGSSRGRITGTAHVKVI